MSRDIRTIAIGGGGPTGAALATYLARAGLEVVLYADKKRPPLIVGESLVPAIVPFLQELGIEDEVRRFSILKPGATFMLPDGEMTFRFGEVRKARSTYSYNTPRDRFDAAFLGAAERAGAHIVEHTARFERSGDGSGVALAQESLDAARPFLDDPPDWIVDASGRRRSLSQLLDLPYETGDRRDIALFAHMEGVPLLHEGHIHSDILEHGWSWRIPLPGRVSVGFVVDGDVLSRFGRTAAEQFDNFLASDKVVAQWGGSPKRITQVMKYNNYQLATLRGWGEGWSLVGDAFGFVDPTFSSGLLVGLDGARRLSSAILDGRDAAFDRYERDVIHHLRNWRLVAGYFYSGRLFTLLRVGLEMRERLIGRIFDFHFQKHLPRVFTGESTTKRYSVGLLDFMCRYGIYNNDPTERAVR